MRLPIPGLSPGTAGYRVTARPSGDSFSQINRIVKPRVRLIRRTGLTIPCAQGKGNSEFLDAIGRSLVSSPDHEVNFGSNYGFHWSLNGKTMCGLQNARQFGRGCAAEGSR